MGRFRVPIAWLRSFLGLPKALDYGIALKLYRSHCPFDFFLSQGENLKLCWLPYLALMKKLELCIPWLVVGEQRPIEQPHSIRAYRIPVYFGSCGLVSRPMQDRGIFHVKGLKVPAQVAPLFRPFFSPCVLLIFFKLLVPCWGFSTIFIVELEGSIWKPRHTAV